MEDFKLEGLQGVGNARLSALNNYISNSESTLPTSTKFTIPALKARTERKDGSESNINQFLLKQLQDQNTNRTDRFKVPKLGKVESGNGFELKREIASNTPPAIVDILKTNSSKQFKRDHEEGVTRTKSEENIIDLTSALSATRIGSSNNVLSRDQRNKTQTETFEIPFIDCDRQQPQTDNYCLIDISQIRFQHNLAPPSSLGRILSSKTRRIQHPRLPIQKSTLKAKHHVDRFLFDTKSPDDVISAALSRFTRTQ